MKNSKPLPRVKLTLPPGWNSSDAGLPDLSFPLEMDDPEYEGELWSATKLSWQLKIRWMGNHAKYHCWVLQHENEDEPREALTFDYPHEVVDWLGKWFAHLAQAKV